MLTAASCVMLAPLFGFSGFPLVYRMWGPQPSETAVRSTRVRVGIVVYREYAPPADLVGVFRFLKDLA